jgi:phenylpyruvate tautomerase PptA (4-oxalocrotonate tautomerase family)
VSRKQAVIAEVTAHIAKHLNITFTDKSSITDSWMGDHA